MPRGWMRVVAAGILIPAAACSRGSGDADAAARRPRLSISTVASSRVDLDRRAAELRAALSRDPANALAAVALADTLIRQTRVSNNAGLAAEAATGLTAALGKDPDHYEARRMLAAVHLSQHRFRDALAAGRRALTVRHDDDYIYGIVGDAHLELGEYTEAFEAFDRMNALKPTAGSYARTSYARELQGDLAGAIRLMQMATEATPPQDVESLAWHRAQLGHLYLQQGRTDDAAREYAHADFLFPGHPFATDGLARVAAARGDYQAALAVVNRRIGENPMPADFALAGDLLQRLGRRDDAERQYRLAEAAWTADVPEPGRLARFQAERGRRISDALRMAEATLVVQKDIFTADAFAWALYQAGDLTRAQAAIADAMRTGTKDRVILYHAAEIARAAGDAAKARRLVSDALAGAPNFDLVAAPAARQLQTSLGFPRVAIR